jgi:N-acetylglucosaminyldiphosphoundecaprenol N-acetyl-beta-D-mannosaminyltransferase
MNERDQTLLLSRASSPRQPSVMSVLGSRVHMVQIQEVMDLFRHWIQHEPSLNHVVISTGMHGVIEAHDDPEFRAILNSADLFTPDGISVKWLGQLRGYPLKRRVTGVDLLEASFAMSEKERYRHYFYGDTEETLEAMRGNLMRRFPRLRIVGLHSPPFRALTPQEDEQVVRTINSARPHFLWVGLGLPKQERWMHAHKSRLTVPIAAGVGAGFKFLSGTVKRAPGWVGEHGFEWLWRLVQEPRVTWRRVFLMGPRFVWLAGRELWQGTGHAV